MRVGVLVVRRAPGCRSTSPTRAEITSGAATGGWAIAGVGHLDERHLAYGLGEAVADAVPEGHRPRGERARERDPQEPVLDDLDRDACALEIGVDRGDHEHTAGRVDVGGQHVDVDRLLVLAGTRCGAR